jgi:hypothetical protein
MLKRITSILLTAVIGLCLSISAQATTGYNVTLRNAQLNAITTAVGNAGTLTIYCGTQPATGGSATTVAAVFTLGSPFAPSASSAVLSPTITSSMSSGVAGVASCSATWFRVATSGGTQVIDGTVGTSGADLNLNTTSISVGVNVTIPTWTIIRGNP